MLLGANFRVLLRTSFSILYLRVSFSILSRSTTIFSNLRLVNEEVLLYWSCLVFQCSSVWQTQSRIINWSLGFEFQFDVVVVVQTSSTCACEVFGFLYLLHVDNFVLNSFLILLEESFHLFLRYLPSKDQSRYGKEMK